VNLDGIRSDASLASGRAAMSFDEIASELRCSKSLVWKLYRSGINKLRARRCDLVRMRGLANQLDHGRASENELQPPTFSKRKGGAQ
jgi:AcrR family transcriptional regulator